MPNLLKVMRNHSLCESHDSRLGSHILDKAFQDWLTYLQVGVLSQKERSPSSIQMTLDQSSIDQLRQIKSPEKHRNY